jgi:hypothetical protein
VTSATSLDLTPTPDTPAAVLGMLERRTTVGTIVILVGLAAVAWALTV